MASAEPDELSRDGQLVQQLAAAGAAGFLLWSGQIFQFNARLPAHPQLALVALLVSLGAFTALAYAVAAPSLPPRVSSPAVYVMVGAILVTCAAAISVLILFETPFYGTDGIALSHLAAERLLAGHDPYSYTVQGADLARFGVPGYAITTTTYGDLVGPAVSYPAGSFLVYVPALRLGVQDMRWISLAVELIGLLILTIAAPLQWKVLATLAASLNVDVSIYGTAGGRTDWLWLMPCLLMMLSLWSRRVVLGAVFFGLAAALKQQPWLLAPFVSVWLYHTGGTDARRRWVRVVKFAGIAAGVFALINAPFVVADPGSWWYGVTAPLSEPLIPHGQGLSLLTQFGLLELPKTAYTILAIGGLATLCFCYAVWFRRIPAAAWVLPAFVLWVSYRSYQDYFLYWIPLLVLGLLLERRRRCACG